MSSLSTALFLRSLTVLNPGTAGLRALEAALRLNRVAFGLTALDLSSTSAARFDKLKGKESTLGALLTTLTRLRLLNLRGNYLGDDGIQMLCAALTRLRDLTDLDLSDNRISDVDAIAIAQVLPQLSHLVAFKFHAGSSNGAAQVHTSLTTLSGALRALTQLTDINLGGHNATACESHLFRDLSSLTGLKRLDLNGLDGGDAIWTEFASCLKSLPKLEVVAFPPPQSKSPPPGTPPKTRPPPPAVFNALQSCRSLTILDVDVTQADDSLSAAIAAASAALTHISLRADPCAPSPLRAGVLPAIAMCSNLTRLDLRHTPIAHSSAQALFETPSPRLKALALQHIFRRTGVAAALRRAEGMVARLEQLELRDNQFSLEESLALVASIGAGRRLKSLTLATCAGVGDATEAGVAFASAMMGFGALTELDIGGGGWTIAHIAESFQRLPLLESLNLEKSDFKGAGAAAMFSFLPRHLKKLKLEHCLWDAAAVDALAAALTILTDLSEIDFNGGDLAADDCSRIARKFEFCPSLRVIVGLDVVTLAREVCSALLSAPLPPPQRATLREPDIAQGGSIFLPHGVRGNHAVWRHFSTLRRGSGQRISGGGGKVIVLGDGGVGKTTLVRRLVTGRFEAQGQDVTQGVAVSSVTKGGVDFTFFDFAGQALFQIAHPLFFSPDAIVLVVASTRAGLPSDQTHASFSRWFASFANRFPLKPPPPCVGPHFAIVGTRVREGGPNIDVLNRPFYADLISAARLMPAPLYVDSECGDGIERLWRFLMLYAQPRVNRPAPDLLRDVSAVLGDLRRQREAIVDVQTLLGRPPLSAHPKAKVEEALRRCDSSGCLFYFPKELPDVVFLDPPVLTNLAAQMMDPRRPLVKFLKTDAITRLARALRGDAAMAERCVGLFNKLALLYEVAIPTGHLIVVPGLLEDAPPLQAAQSRLAAVFDIANDGLSAFASNRLVVRLSSRAKEVWRREVLLEDPLGGTETRVRVRATPSCVRLEIEGPAALGMLRWGGDEIELLFKREMRSMPYKVRLEFFEGGVSLCSRTPEMLLAALSADADAVIGGGGGR